jgi:outer membrane protein assembly factor BamE (lipoprotein component of BamABCDE complex)
MRWPRVRFTVRRIMILIAVIGFALFAVRQTYFANTLYSVRYDESRFRQVRAGMTSSEVEALMGPPLEKVSAPQIGVVIWLYTDRLHNRGGDYWKRDVWMEDDKVVNLVNIYYSD